MEKKIARRIHDDLASNGDVFGIQVTMFPEISRKEILVAAQGRGADRAMLYASLVTISCFVVCGLAVLWWRFKRRMLKTPTGNERSPATRTTLFQQSELEIGKLQRSKQEHVAINPPTLRSKREAAVIVFAEDRAA